MITNKYQWWCTTPDQITHGYQKCLGQLYHDNEGNLHREVQKWITDFLNRGTISLDSFFKGAKEHVMVTRVRCIHDDYYTQP